MPYPGVTVALITKFAQLLTSFAVTSAARRHGRRSSLDLRRDFGPIEKNREQPFIQPLQNRNGRISGIRRNARRVRAPPPI
jgi:hypothetical protein